MPSVTTAVEREVTEGYLFILWLSRGQKALGEDPQFLGTTRIQISARLFLYEKKN